MLARGEQKCRDLWSRLWRLSVVTAASCRYPMEGSKSHVKGVGPVVREKGPASGSLGLRSGRHHTTSPRQYVVGDGGPDLHESHYEQCRLQKRRVNSRWLYSVRSSPLSNGFRRHTSAPGALWFAARTDIIPGWAGDGAGSISNNYHVIVENWV